MNIDKQLDEIFDEIDDLCLAGKFDEVDKILDDVDVEKHPTTILIGYLSITLPFMKWRHISNTGHISKAREKLFRRIYEKLKRDEPEDRARRLLKSLGLNVYMNFLFEN